LNRSVSSLATDMLAKPDVTVEQLKRCVSDLIESERELFRKAEELLASRSALAAEREYYRELFGFAPEAQAITDSDGVILEANRACAQLLQVHPRYLEHKPIWRFLGRRDCNRIAAGFMAGRSDAAYTTACMICPRYEEAMLGIVSVLRMSHDPERRMHWMLREAGQWL
jgi:PAS domain-containing protein